MGPHPGQAGRKGGPGSCGRRRRGWQEVALAVAAGGKELVSVAALDLSKLERVGAAESHRCVPHPAGHPSRLPHRSLWVEARDGASAGEDASLELGLVGAEDVDEGDTILRHLLELALGAVEVQAPTEATRAGVRTTLGAAEEEEEASEGKEGEEEVAYEGEEFAQAGGVTLGDGDVDVVGGEDVNEVRGVGDDNGGVTIVDGGKLQ
uniref:Uncharacterized protein n=1 Tax=Oryza meridionalis TaxID=40149 RepID=A0A0E0DBJ0_9ORYZ